MVRREETRKIIVIASISRTGRRDRGSISINLSRAGRREIKRVSLIISVRGLQRPGKDITAPKNIKYSSMRGNQDDAKREKKETMDFYKSK